MDIIHWAVMAAMVLSAVCLISGFPLTFCHDLRTIKDGRLLVLVGWMLAMIVAFPTSTFAGRWWLCARLMASVASGLLIWCFLVVFRAERERLS